MDQPFQERPKNWTQNNNMFYMFYNRHGWVINILSLLIYSQTSPKTKTWTRSIFQGLISGLKIHRCTNSMQSFITALRSHSQSSSNQMEPFLRSYKQVKTGFVLEKRALQVSGVHFWRWQKFLSKHVFKFKKCCVIS